MKEAPSLFAGDGAFFMPINERGESK